MRFILEQHRFFPFIAWTVCIGFALFVLGLALQLQETSAHLADKNDALERVVQDDSLRLETVLEETDQ